MSKIDRIVISETKTDKDYSSLVAMINDSGDLVLEGYDEGEFPKSFWGDEDYEYWLYIKGEFKDTVLLWLIKERFKNDSEFREWLNEKGIPSEFGSWV